MKKILFITILTCGFLCNIIAQHAPQYTNFMFNKLAYNPAYAGSNDVLSMSSIYRHQWAGIEGAPRTIIFNAHAPFFRNKCGIGLSISNDQAGMLNTTYANLSYNYRIPVGENSTLAMGVMGRLEHGRVDWSSVDAVDEGDQIVGMDSDASRVKPNFGVGLYLNNPNYYIGISAPQLLANTLYSDLGFEDDMRTYYIMGGFVAKLSDNVKFKPGVLFSINPSSPFEMDLNANFIFMDAFWVGASYRMGDSIDGIFAYQFSAPLRLGLALDFTLSELQNHTRGGFELLLQYDFRFTESSVNNLRYF